MDATRRPGESYLGGRRRKGREWACRSGIAKLLQSLLKVDDAVFLLRVEARLVLVHLGDVVVLAVQVVELGGDAVDFILSFTHVLVVGGLDQNYVHAVGFLEVEDGHGMHIVDMAVEVGHSLAVAGTLADSNQSDHDKESDDQSYLAIGDV